MLVGVLALPVAAIVSGTRNTGVAWNVLGILDLADAVILGTLVVQGQPPFPIVMIPSFVVPLSLLLHALSLRQLYRGGSSASHAATTAGQRSWSPV
jgi:hypothetical protein